MKTHIETRTVSAVSAESFNNVFTSTYKNYLIVANVTPSADGTLRYRMRASGTDETGANYFWSGSTTDISTSTFTSERASSQTSGLLATYASFRILSVEMLVYSPQINAITQLTTRGTIQNNSGANWISHLHNAAAARDGITIFPNTGTITGEISIYGYRTS